MVVEFVIVIPILFLVFALIYAFGQKVQADGLLDSGARDGARAASQARSFDEAQRVATLAVTSVIGGSSAECSNSLVVSVDDGDASQFEPGQPVTVDASCNYHVYLAGVTLTLKPKSSFSSQLDVNRGVCAPGDDTC
jgi:Flp pilus assembly protein TadG